jgi:hypothetical protein
MKTSFTYLNQEETKRLVAVCTTASPIADFTLQISEPTKSAAQLSSSTGLFIDKLG